MPLSLQSEKIIEKYPELSHTASALSHAILHNARINGNCSSVEFFRLSAKLRRKHTLKALRMNLTDENVSAWMREDLPRRKRSQKLMRNLINACEELTIGRVERKVRLTGLSV